MSGHESNIVAVISESRPERPGREAAKSGKG
jgi:hypothetical protein